MSMANLMFLRPRTLPCYFLFSPPLLIYKLLPKSSFLPLLPTPSISTCSSSIQISVPSNSIGFTYGPSLWKGTLPSKSPSQVDPNSDFVSHHYTEEDKEIFFDEDRFTRVYEIAALRVPSEECYSLESRLRGHLLNWPRIRNIARVPGDEMDEEIQELLARNNSVSDEAEMTKVLERRIHGKAEGDGEELGSVLYRDKLAKEFNAKGFVNFRNLAKISRPKQNKNKKRKEEREEKLKRVGGRRESVLVEVVEEGGSDDAGEVEENLSGLLGIKFERRKWRGSTRLLLLDERYARKEADELPEAVKVALQDSTTPATISHSELVRCQLTLFYNYWPMIERRGCATPVNVLLRKCCGFGSTWKRISSVLEALLPQGMIVPSAFETVGHIAHLNLRDEHLPYKKLIAKVVLDKNKPKVQTVVNKVDAISNNYRTMQLEVLAGNHSLVTIVIENGVRFHVDLATVYWNSRLATERQRLLSCFTRDDVVCDVFSGVGPIAIAAAKKVKRVYANDLNPYAVDYLERNCVFNKLERKIEVYNMDGRRFINAIFSSEKGSSITQVVMNLPNDAAEFLDAFKGIFNKKPKDTRPTSPKIHVYGFSKAEDPDFDFHERIRIALAEVAVNVEMRRVRLVAPGKYMLCASFILPDSVAYGKSVQNL